MTPAAILLPVFWTWPANGYVTAHYLWFTRQCPCGRWRWAHQAMDIGKN